MNLNNYYLMNKVVYGAIILLAALGINPVLADDPTNQIKITGKPASDDFGRLFTSQHERNAIDRTRLTGGFVPAQVTGIDEGASSHVESAEPIKLLGVLLRADGKNKVWLSGGTEAQQNILNKRAITGSIRQSANVKVGVNNGTILKPGQVWSVATGKQESYQIPVPKPVMPESVAEPASRNQSSAAVPKFQEQTSSVSSSEVSSSVQSSTK